MEQNKLTSENIGHDEPDHFFERNSPQTWHLMTQEQNTTGRTKIAAAVIDTRWHERHQRWKRNETHFTIITAQKRATHINKLTSYSGWFKKRKKRNKTKPSVFSSPSFFLFFIFARFYHERKWLIPRVVLLSDASIVGFWYNRSHVRTLRHMINSTYDRRLFWCLFSSQDYHRESDNSHSMQRKSGGGGWGGGWKGGRVNRGIPEFLLLYLS